MTAIHFFRSDYVCAHLWGGLRRVAFSLLLALFALTSPAHAQPNAVKVTAQADRDRVPPGGTFLIAVTFSQSEGFHLHTNAPIVAPEMGDFEPIPTKIQALLAPAQGTLGTIAWPKPVEVLVNLGEKPAKYLVFDHIATAFVPITLAPTATGAVEITLTTSFQACNDRICLAPSKSTSSVTIQVDAAAPAAPTLDAPPFQSYIPAPQTATTPQGNPALPSPGTKPPAAAQPDSGLLEFPFFGTQFSIDPRGGFGLALLALLAAAGGFLLNLMPCVLPVIPLKIVALANAAGTKQRTMVLGLAMSGGVILFWLALGAVIALSTGFKSPSQIISTWWFTVGIGALIAGMAVSLLGIFNFNVPNWAYAVNPRHDTIHGSVLFGVLTAVLATPCVAPLAATAMSWAAYQPSLTTMLVFTAIGVGMAIPYFLLAANPSWVARVPRAGPSSELLKQTMALFMFAVAAFFVGVGLQTLLVRSPHLGGVLHWWAVGLLTLAACAWMVVRIWQITTTNPTRIMVTVIGISLGYGAIVYAQSQTLQAKEAYVGGESKYGVHGAWQGYTPELLEQALRDNKVVVVNFTAEWCLNCKAFDSILNSDAVQTELKKPDVVALVADLTNEERSDGTANPAWAYMYSLKEIGPPILVIYGPGRATPFKANSYTTQKVLDEIAASRAN